MTAIAALLDVVPGWIYALIIAALLALGVTQELRVGAYKIQVAHEQQAHADTKMQYAEAAAKGQADARRKEKDLQSAIDRQREAKDAEINMLRTDVRDLRQRLSHLPTRPAGDPGAATASFGQAPASCPGPILYLDTAEALADEAERADLIRINLKACYSAWDQARALTLQTK
jgi:hypothetical protein